MFTRALAASVAPFLSALALGWGCCAAQAADGTVPPPLSARAKEAGPIWASLTASQRTALTPLKRDWSSIDADRKQKWLEIVARFPSMPLAEQRRVQERMAAWARLSPADRTSARLHFQEARQLSPEDRQAKWDAYQALPAEERRELAERARPTTSRPTPNAATDVKATDTANPKRNIVQPQSSTTAKVVTPTVVQAKPGATTTLISSPARPPAHHQPGLPKIAATEGFVNPATLLPRRGPQGAAVQEPEPNKADEQQ